MRISTAMLHQQGVGSMLEQQAQLARTQQQLASNRKWTSAADDPVAYAAAEALDRQIAQTDRYTSNAQMSRHRLLMEEDALAEGVDILQRVRELTVRANSAGQSADSRAAIALELHELREQLLAVANRDDGQGRYLFAGSVDAQAPFSWNGSALLYGGDQRVRSVQIGASRSIAEGDAGDTVFMGLRSGNGAFAVSADAANTGAAQLTAAKLFDADAWGDTAYTVTFTGGGYEIVNTSGDIVQSGSYEAGSAIRFNGVELTFGGVPADGDRFTLAASQPIDVVSLVDTLAALVAQPQDGAAQRAQWQTALQQRLSELDAAQSRISDVRAGVGLRLAAAESAEGQLSAQRVHAQEALSELRDLDYAEAAARLQQQLVALQAAQQTYLRVQGLSLFDYLR